MKIKKISIEKFFVIFVLIRSTGAIMPLLNEEAINYLNPVTINLIDSVVSIGVGFIALFLCLSHFKSCLKAIKSNAILSMLLGLVIISFFWSNYPELTMLKSISLVGTSLFGVYLAVRFNKDEILKLLLWTMAISALLSIIFALLIPYLGLHSDEIHNQAWRGIYGHKNTLGRLMVLAAICAIALARNSKMKSKFILWAFAGMFISIVFLAKSTTAIIILLVLLVLMPSLRMINLNKLIVIPGVILIIVSSSLLFAWLLVNIDTVLLSIGRDLTLTGRTVLWEVVWDMIKERFWLGYGFGAFWLGDEGPSSEVWKYIQWETPDAHNGLLDLWINIGFVGVVLFSISLISNIVRAVFWARKYSENINVFPLVYFTFFIFINISESTIMVQNPIFWVLYVAFTVMLNNGKGGSCHEDHYRP